ncbi:MAG TPA: FHA domain-containing protein [Humisphaera sp.]
MAYVVVSFKGQEVGRWPLDRGVTIGRSTECDVVVRDILLSRQHCRLEPYRSGWVAVDLGSKNGTLSEEGNRITRRGLRDGEVLTLGKTTVRFRMGRLPADHQPPRKRPADPFEALSGTVHGFEAGPFDPAAAEAFRRANGLPSPRPVPKEPDAYEKDDLYGLLTEIASSSWDSIYAQASQPKRPIPTVDGSPRPTSAASGAGGTGVTRSPAGAATLVGRQRQARLFADDLQVGESTAAKVVRPANPFAARPLIEAAPTADASSDLSFSEPRPDGWLRRSLKAVRRALRI